MQKNWTKKEESYLIAKYHIESIEFIMEKLQRSKMSIRRKAHDIGLKRGVLNDGHRDSRTTLGYKKRLEFAYSLGCKNISQAIDKLGGYMQFNKHFKGCDRTNLV